MYEVILRVTEFPETGKMRLIVYIPKDIEEYATLKERSVVTDLATRLSDLVDSYADELSE